MTAADFWVRFDTLGCRLNQMETEAAAGRFLAEGFSIASGNPDTLSAGSPETAGKPPVLCVINTCAVTAKAEQKARRLIRLLRKHYPQTAVLVTGCYAQTDRAAISAMDSALIVLPGKRKDILLRLPPVLKAALENGPADPGAAARAVREFCRTEIAAAGPEAPDLSGSAWPAEPADNLSAESARALSFHSRAFVKIQDGCSNRCTFCKTRLARGPSRSVPAETILSRVRILENAGWGEAVLTGVNLRQYRDPGSGADLGGLLRCLLDGTSRIFLRISSLYPESVTPELAGILRAERICPFFHLSVQSGSPSVLQNMGRTYGPDQVREAVRLLREAKTDPFLSCDIITGFPGESGGDFLLTENLCRDLDFAHIHIFPFSPRPGTEAAGMKPCVPQRIARERADRLETLSQDGFARYIRRWSGKRLAGIFQYSGKTKRPEVFTVNALALPLDTGAYEASGKPQAEILRSSPQNLRGAAIAVQIPAYSRTQEIPAAVLENFLFSV